MEQKSKNVHWFPGHMKKASIQIEERVKLVDFVIVLLDSRIPLSSRNGMLERITKNKKKLYILTKIDLSDEEMTKKWIKELSNNGDEAIAINLCDNSSKDLLIKKMNEFALIKKDKYLARGVKNVTIKSMIIGIPNVGKSTLINLFASKKLAKTANTPGVTRSVTWIKVGNFELVDVPGILEPNYKDKNKAVNLALVGSMKESILPNHDLCNIMLDFMKKYYSKNLEERYGIENVTSIENSKIVEEICKKRGFLEKHGDLDIDKCELVLLNEFRNGKIARFTLERI